MNRSGQCPICKLWFSNLTKHHIWRRAVWGRKIENKTILICTDCHAALEKEITRRENVFLQQHPEIYEETLKEFLSGEMQSRIEAEMTNRLKRAKTRQNAKINIGIVIKNYHQIKEEI